MKKFLLWVIYAFLCASIFPLKAQPFLEEHFNYTPGVLNIVSGGLWRDVVNGISPVKVVEGNLTYDNYSNTAAGNYIFIDDSSAIRHSVERNFGSTFTAGSLYFSFLMKVKDTLDFTTSTSTGVTLFNGLNVDNFGKLFLQLKRLPVINKFMIGINKNGSSTKWDSVNSYAIQQTLLVILKYKFGSGSDTAKLWINPDLSGAEPLPNVYTFSETDIINLAGIAFKQTTNGGNIYIDAFRVSTSWDNIPLPVQLSTFTCNADERGVTLKWKTETEIDNFGFEVQRKEENSEWSNRIFIDGAGNSNAPNYYSFVDNELNEPGIYYYRLKQIDNSGDSIFSDSISADTRLAGSFQLFPNYPNPFNPSTTIHFLLPGTGFTSLAVYNLLGERVRQLKESIMYAGFYSITFDGSDLNSGIYFCVLEHSGTKRVIKLLLVK